MPNTQPVQTGLLYQGVNKIVDQRKYIPILTSSDGGGPMVFIDDDFLGAFCDYKKWSDNVDPIDYFLWNDFIFLLPPRNTQEAAFHSFFIIVRSFVPPLLPWEISKK